MKIRPKTVRRLAILAAAFLLFSGGLGLLLLRSLHLQKARIADLKVKAFDAFKREDYSSAVDEFKDYLTLSGTQDSDPEAVYAYGISRARTPMEGNRQIVEGIGVLQHYLDLVSPNDPHDASHELLKLYLKAGEKPEARKLAAKLLAKNPRDVEALRTQVQTLIGDHNLAAALTACQALNKVDPDDLQWQRRELGLMAELKQPGSQLLAHAKQLLDQHPNDPRFIALIAVAQQADGDSAGSAKSLEEAAHLPPPDAEAALQIIGLLDITQRFQLADDLLARANSKFTDPRLEQLAAQRLFEQNEFKPLLDRLAKVDSKSPTVQPAMLGFKACALYQLRDRKGGDAIVDALAARKDDASIAWAEALRTRYSLGVPEPAKSIQTYRDAISRDPENPVFRLFLGDARSELGEPDEAMRDWLAASRLSPSWALPVYRISRTESANKNYSAALATAKLLMRQTHDLIGVEAFAIAEWGLIESNPERVAGAEGNHLLSLLGVIRAQAPHETETLPIDVALLNRRGQRGKAIELVKDALDWNPPLPEPVLGQLAAVSAKEHLDLDAVILDRDQASHGMTPAIAFTRAALLYDAHKNAQASELVEALRKSHPNDPVWQLAEARFLDAIGDPNALKTWIALGDAHPNDIRIQYQALLSPSRFKDRAFWERTIGRVKSLTGADAQAWQIDQARFCLSGPATPKQLDDTIASLQIVVRESPELPEPHRLLAEAMQRTGKAENLSAAVAELNAAHNLQPDDFQTTAELAAAEAAQGRRDRAAALVDSVAASADLPEEHRIWAARMYGQLGKVDAGIKLLTASAATQPAEAGAARDVLLAELYVAAGRLAEASQIYLKILDEPNPAPRPLILAAEFFAKSHQPAQAQRFLDRIEKMNATPGTIEVLRANLAENEGRLDDAAHILADASAAHPKIAQIWLDRAGLSLRRADLDGADKIAVDGLQANPSDPTLTALRTQIARLRELNVTELLPIVATISANPSDPAADQTLKLLIEARQRKDSPQQILANLSQLGDRYPSYLPLQEILVKGYIDRRQFKEASELASRACEIAPNDPLPLRLLYAAASAGGNWEQARNAAVRWRQMSASDPLQPDLEIATTYLQQSPPDPAAALKQIEPYIADTAPEHQTPKVLGVYCRALLAEGKVDDAAARLMPLIDKGPQWVELWLNLGVTAPHDAGVATQWLKRLAPAIKPDAAAEQVALAQAWEQVGMKFDSIAAHDAARDLLQPIISHPPVPLPAWSAWALVNQSLGNLEEAERGWQEFLKLQPGNPNAANNLAFVMLLEGSADKLPRAEQLATSAIAASPDNSQFYDTLARVERQTGKSAEAIKNFRIALAKDPNDVEAMIGLADVLQSQANGRDEARSLLARITVLVDGGAPLAAPIRRQLERVKSALSSI